MLSKRYKQILKNLENKIIDIQANKKFDQIFANKVGHQVWLSISFGAQFGLTQDCNGQTNLNSELNFIQGLFGLVT